MSWKWIDDKEKGKADRAMDEFYETKFFIMGLMILMIPIVLCGLLRLLVSVLLSLKKPLEFSILLQGNGIMVQRVQVSFAEKILHLVSGVTTRC